MPSDAATALDSFDRQILALYQRNTRLPGEQIGAQVGLSAAAVQRRIKRMREAGVIQAEVAVLDCQQLGLGVTAIVPDLAAYDVFCKACLLHDANVRSFTTHNVLEAAKRTGPLAF